MKEEIIKHLEHLIDEHKKADYCTEWEEVQNELDADRAGFIGYDCGRYETLVKLLDDIKKMEL